MARFRCFLLSSASGALALAALAVPVHADSFTIGPGQTEGQQVLDGDGETGLIEAGGTISTSQPGSAGNGVSSSGDNVVIDNRGTIETTGTYDAGDGRGPVGIYSTGEDAQITNSGTIKTERYGAHGLYSTGDGAQITNSGTIETEGSLVHGFYSTGAGARIANSGTIRTEGDDYAVGLASEGEDARITNSGTIQTEGDYAHSLASTGAGAQITNSGTIETEGGGAYGLVSEGEDARITNSGTIQTEGVNAVGLWSGGDGARITNSGTIRAAQANSIVIWGDNTRLNLLPGSVLAGDLFVEQPVASTATLNLAPGLSAVLNFAATSFNVYDGGLPATINTSGMPLVVDTAGWTVITADVTALRAQGAALGDLTSGIFGAIGSRRAAGTMRAPLAYAPDAAPQTSVWRKGADYSREVWLRGFGSWRDQDANSTNAAYDGRLAGFVSGVDVVASEASTFGLFVGGAWAKTDVPLSQELESESFFGGLYGTLDLGASSLDLGLLAGWSSYDSARRVADMNAPNGLAMAEADYDGFFISPHVELTTPFSFIGQAFEAKGALRYAGLFLDGFTETGTSGNLTVEDRDLHLITARGALSMTREYVHRDGAATRFIPAIGIEARVQFGDDDVSGTLAGTGITFDAENGETLAGFVGLRAEHETASGLAFHGEGEALFKDGGHRFSVKGGLSARF